MLRVIRSAFSAVNPFNLPDTDPVERFANSGWSTAASPDDLIAAAIVESFAKDFDKWQLQDIWRGVIVPYDSSLKYAPARERATLLQIHPQSDQTVITVSLSLKRTAKDRDNRGPWLYSIARGPCSVNGVELNNKASACIASAYCSIKLQIAAAEAAALEAQAAMRINEKKWNLAESLLGMKRNEHGALVPVVSLEHDCDCGGLPCLCPPKGAIETTADRETRISPPVKRIDRRPRQPKNRFDSAASA
jgi:hypothetical protein